MRSPILTALLNPLNLVALAISVAAGLCAAWWLFPLGLIVWGLMVVVVASDKRLKLEYTQQAWAPLAQRFQPGFDKLTRTQASMYNSISDFNPRLLALLEPVNNEVNALVERTHQVCNKMTSLENYRSVQVFNGNLQAQVVNLDTQIATATDPQVKKDYETSRQAIQKQMDALQAIGVQSDRVEAQLASMSAELSGIQAQIVQLQALNVAQAQPLIPPQLEAIRKLLGELNEFDRDVSKLSLK
jgi:biotin operon repressor